MKKVRKRIAFLVAALIVLSFAVSVNAEELPLEPEMIETGEAVAIIDEVEIHIPQDTPPDDTQDVPSDETDETQDSPSDGTQNIPPDSVQDYPAEPNEENQYDGEVSEPQDAEVEVEAEVVSVISPNEVQSISVWDSGSYAYPYEVPTDPSDLSKQKPAGVKVTNAGYDSLLVSWNKLSGASGYYIYRSEAKNDTYKKIKTISGESSTNYKNTGLVTGKAYYYKIVAYKSTSTGTVKSASSAAVPGKPVTSEVTALKTKSYSGGKVRLTWKKPAGASGYYVYRAASKNGTYKNIHTITSGSTQSFTSSGLTSGKTYYYKLIPYTTVSGVKVRGTTSVIVPGKAG